MNNYTVAYYRCNGTFCIYPYEIKKLVGPHSHVILNGPIEVKIEVKDERRT